METTRDHKPAPAWTYETGYFAQDTHKAPHTNTNLSSHLRQLSPKQQIRYYSLITDFQQTLSGTRKRPIHRQSWHFSI